MEKNTGVYKNCISFRLEVRGNDCKCLFECNARAMGGNQREVRIQSESVNAVMIAKCIILVLLMKDFV